MSDLGDPAETATFAQALASLKRRGSNLLLVGVPRDAHLAAARRLLGADGAATPRARLLVSTAGAPSADTLGEFAEEHVRTIDYEALTRGTAAAATPSGPIAPTTPRPASLPALGDAIVDAIEAFENERGGLAPAELRVRVDSLVPLVEEHDEETVFGFLHALTSDVAAANAMAHYHLPVAPDDELVRTLAPLFEAVVELRTGRDGPQQRWRLTDDDVTTEWLPV